MIENSLNVDMKACTFRWTIDVLFWLVWSLSISKSLDGWMIWVLLSSVSFRFCVLREGNSFNVHRLQICRERDFTVQFFCILEIFKHETGVRYWHTSHFTCFLFVPTALLHILHFADYFWHGNQVLGSAPHLQIKLSCMKQQNLRNN